MFGAPHLTMVDYWNVRRPTFKPTTSESRRRRTFMEADLVSLLGECIPNLPWELLYQIAGYGSSAYAVTHLTTRMGMPRGYSFDLRQDVWARYVDFEGQRYIRVLYNTAHNFSLHSWGGTPVLIFNAKAYRTTYVMLIEMSALGIRRIMFTDDSSRPKIEKKPGVWWKVMSFQDGPLVVGETDGVKLRHLMFESDKVETSTSRSSLNFMWPTPAKYDHYNQSYDEFRTPRSLLPKYSRRMDSVDLRRPDILGLSFAVFTGRFPHYHRSIINVHAHLPEENHNFYREVERKAQGHITWQHIPLEPQEFITEIWARNAREKRSITLDEHGRPNRPPWPPGSLWHYWQLLFKTSKGLIHQIGSARHGPSSVWKLVHSSSQGPERIFCEHTDDARLGAWSLGFERTNSEHVAARARQPRSDDHPTLGWPHSLHTRMANCSSAALDGVIEVTQCLRIPNNRDSPGIGKYTSGLLLRYQDGHVERLGEARLDFTKSCKVLPTDVLGFSFQKKLVKICTVGPAQGNDEPSARYVEIPMRGTLHWCFHGQEALLRHNEQRISPKSRLVE